MVQCRNCGRSVDKSDNYCEFCEEPLNFKQDSQTASQQNIQGDQSQQKEAVGKRSQANGPNQVGQRNRRSTAQSNNYNSNADTIQSQNTRTAGEILGEDLVQKYIKYCVGIFVVIGVGFSISFILLNALAPESFSNQLGGGELALAGLFITFMLTPLLSGVLGIIIGLEMQDNRKSASLAAGVGSFVGYLALLFTLIIAGGIVSDGGSGVGEGLGAMLGWGLGVAIAGAASAAVTKQVLEGGLERNNSVN
jgi:hypothetical protein